MHLYVSSKAVALARKLPTSEVLTVQVCAQQIADTPQIYSFLQTQLRMLEPSSPDVELVLAPEFYALSVLEKPAVEDNEVNEALRWQLQENTEFDVSDAAIDSFSLPESASRGRDLRFAAVAPNEPLRELVAACSRAGLQVSSIRISALCLTNILWHLYESAEHGFAVLRVSADTGAISVSRGAELFLSRRMSSFPLELDAPGWERYRDQLLLQIQRSIDYYESTLGQPPCTCLFVASDTQRLEPITSYLSEMLTVPVRPLIPELKKNIPLELHIAGEHFGANDELGSNEQDILSQVLPVIGAVLSSAEVTT